MKIDYSSRKSYMKSYCYNTCNVIEVNAMQALILCSVLHSMFCSSFYVLFFIVCSVLHSMFCSSLYVLFFILCSVFHCMFCSAL